MVCIIMNQIRSIGKNHVGLLSCNFKIDDHREFWHIYGWTILLANGVASKVDLTMEETPWLSALKLEKSHCFTSMSITYMQWVLNVPFILMEDGSCEPLLVKYGSMSLTQKTTVESSSNIIKIDLLWKTSIYQVLRCLLH